MTILFGGSFDPPHLGHTEIASKILKRYNPTTLYFIPNTRNPLKESAGESVEARLELLQLALNATEERRFRILDWEIRRPAPSYYIDTLRTWHEQFTEIPVTLMGHEVFQQLPQWKDPKTLVTLSHFVVFTRSGKPTAPLAPTLTALGIKPGEGNRMALSPQTWIETLELETPLVSSTEVRALLAEKSSTQRDAKLAHCLHAPVYQTIKEKALYTVK